MSSLASNEPLMGHLSQRSTPDGRGPLPAVFGTLMGHLRHSCRVVQVAKLNTFERSRRFVPFEVKTLFPVRDFTENTLPVGV